MRVENIETLLVCAIVAIQLYIFYKTFIQIGIYKKTIPNVTKFRITKLYIPHIDIEKLTPKEILSNIEKYLIEDNNEYKNLIFTEVIEGDFEAPEPMNIIDKEIVSNYQLVEISIIECDRNSNIVFKNILFSINNYLLRNRGAASDFNLIKDITERNTDAVEEDINLTISIPLYLGLMGTMLGIVIGLFSMSDLSSTFTGKIGDDQLGQGISVLLGGVKIAMIASFSGLLLTIINSGWFFKGSKSIIETNKNDFYTFIQTELLPIINQSLGSTFESLQRNLLKFNGEFTTNLNRLSGLFNTNYEALILQDKIMSNIDKIDIATIAKYNVKVLKELQISTQEFEKFNIHVSQINSFVSNSTTLTERINEVLSRTGNFQTIAENLDSKLSQSQILLDYLSKHFKDLDNHKLFVTNSVAEVGHSISDTFRELKEHIQTSTKSVEDFTVKEIDLLSKALSENKTNLSNLQFLENLNKEVSQLKKESISQNEKMKSQIEELNKNISKSLRILDKIEHNSLSHVPSNIINFIVKIFKK